MFVEIATVYISVAYGYNPFIILPSMYAVLIVLSRTF